MNGKHRHSPGCDRKPHWKTVAATAFWYAQGCSYKKISGILHIAENTVHHHVSRSGCTCRWSTVSSCPGLS